MKLLVQDFQLLDDVLVHQAVSSLFLDRYGNMNGIRDELAKQWGPKVCVIAKMFGRIRYLWWDTSNSHIGTVENLEFGLGGNVL